MQPESVLLEADGLVNGARNADYGTVQDNYGRIASISQLLGVSVTPKDVLLIMIATKLARHAHRPKRDNLVDLAGYTELLSKWEEIR